VNETTWQVVEHDPRFVDDALVAEFGTKAEARDAAAEWNQRTRAGLTYLVREVA